MICSVPPISLIDLDSNPHPAKSVVAIVPVSLLGSDGFAVTAVGLYFAYARTEICVPPLLAPPAPPRITFIAVPRPFDSPVAPAQKIAREMLALRTPPAPPRPRPFAVESWLSLSPPPEVLVFADDAATAAWAAERPRVRLLSVADKSNQFGTPVLSAM